MGIFDAIANVVSGVGNFVKNSPVLDTIGNLASMVTHVIPGVGPMIDAAVPAINAVFSRDSDAPAPPTNEDNITHGLWSRVLSSSKKTMRPKTKKILNKLFVRPCSHLFSRCSRSSWSDCRRGLTASFITGVFRRGKKKKKT